MTMETRTVDYVIDCGANQATMYDGREINKISRSICVRDTVKEDKIITLSHNDVLELPQKLPSGSFVVCECAHLGCPRGEKSLAQYYTEQELFTLYDEFKSNNITLRLTSQQMTNRARNYAQFDKSDENDPKAIYLWLRHYSHVIDTLMKPPTNFETSAKRIESYGWKEDLDFELNKARARNKKYINEDDENYILLVDNLKDMYHGLSENALSAFGFELYKVSKKGHYKKGDVKIATKSATILKMPPMFAILALFQDSDGNLRFREGTEQFSGWKFIRDYIFKFNPNHFKGGVARSNIKYHGERNWVAKKVAEVMEERRLEKVKMMELAGETVPKGMKDKITTRTMLKKKRDGYFKDGSWGNAFTPEEDVLVLKYRTIYKNAVKEVFMFIKSIHERRIHAYTPVSSRSSSSHPADKLQTRMVQESILT